MHVSAEGQVQHLRRLSQPPVVRLRARQTGAVDSGLLPGPDSDRLPVLDVANRVGLRILQSDQGDLDIPDRLRCQLLILCHNIREKCIINDQVLSALLEGHPEHLLVFDGCRLVGGIDLNDNIVALLLSLQDLQRLLRISRRDDAV